MKEEHGLPDSKQSWPGGFYDFGTQHIQSLGRIYHINLASKESPPSSIAYLLTHICAQIIKKDKRKACSETGQPFRKKGRRSSRGSRTPWSRWPSWRSRCRWSPCPCQTSSRANRPRSPERPGGTRHGGTAGGWWGWPASGTLLFLGGGGTGCWRGQRGKDIQIHSQFGYSA